MLNTFTVSFFGHRRIERFSGLEEQLARLIRTLIETNDYVEFLIGRNGEFDQLASSAIRFAKRTLRSDNSCHTLILPYETAEYRNNQKDFLEYYDSVEVFQPAKPVHFKAAIGARNRQMVDRSDLVVFYFDHESGGAYQTYQYAIQKGKRIVKLKGFSE